MSKDTKSPTSERLPVVVVGGGLAGLAAAVAAARDGQDVLLLEGAGQAGGRAQTRDFEGYRFNLGPRALYVRGAGCAVLEELGVDIPGRKPSLKGAAALVDGKISVLPTDLWTLLRCPWLGARGRLEAAGFFASLPKLDPASVSGESAAAWLERRFNQPEARALFAAFLRLSTYCGDLGDLAASAALEQLQRSSESVIYVDGGWQTLVDGLVRRLTELGGRIETGSKVTAVKPRHGGTIDVHVASDERPLRAAAVVMAVSPAVAGRLVDGFVPSPQARPVFAACLDVGLTCLPDRARLFALGIDRPYYVSVHSATAALAPDNGALVHVLRYLRSGELWTRDALLKDLEAVLDLVQPGWRAVEAHRQFLPKMIVSHDVPGAGRRMAPQRVADGVFVAGDWVDGDGLLADAALASGLRAAAAVKERRAGRCAA